MPNDVFYILSLAPNSSPSFICTLYPVYVHYAHSVYTRIHTVHCTVFNIVCTYIHTRIHTVHYTILYSMHIYTYSHTYCTLYNIVCTYIHTAWKGERTIKINLHIMRVFGSSLPHPRVGIKIV